MSLRWKGLKEFEKKVDRAGRLASKQPRVEVSLQGKSRTSQKNLVILEAQRAFGRNPIFVLGSELNEIMQFAKQYLVKLAAHGKQDRTILNKIGRNLVRNYRNHIMREMSSAGGGSISGYQAPRPLTQRYEKQKRKKHGFVHPILLATKELYRSFKYRVRTG